MAAFIFGARKHWLLYTALSPLRTHLVLLGGVGACLPALVCPPPPAAAPLLSWTRVDLLVRMAEAGLGESEEPGERERSVEHYLT